MSRPHNLGALIAAVTILAVAVAGMAHNLGALSGGLPSWAVPFAAGLLVGSRISFRAGQYARGYSHARGIRRSHWAAIRGGHR